MEQPQDTAPENAVLPDIENLSEEKDKLSFSKENIKGDSKENKKLSLPPRSSNFQSLFDENESVSLREDVFGRYHDENGEEHLVNRYTWKNRNNIQVQVINYGARVTTMKVPDRSGAIEDIVLGFHDIGGYLAYDKHYFGATIGRYSNILQNSSFCLNNNCYNVSSNQGKHCFNGGYNGLDKVIWNTHIEHKKVIMSYVSPNMSDGFPGDLLVRVIFELTAKNEFKIQMNAQSTCPTIVNLSHLLYFNLAGHHKGPDDIYRHVLTMNCNCFTPMNNDGIPTGEIVNVMHTPYDFQIPTLLGRVMGIVPKDGFNQNLCINRGVYQGDCFVGRMFHVPSGRIVEVYSNQPGVQFLTANEFGYKQHIDVEKHTTKKTESIVVDPVMLVYEKVHTNVLKILQVDQERNYQEIVELLVSFIKQNQEKSSVTDFLNNIQLSPTQVEYLEKAKELVCENPETDEPCLDLKEAISIILKVAKKKESNYRYSLEKKSGSKISPGSNIRTSKIDQAGFETSVNGNNNVKPNLKKEFTFPHRNQIPEIYKHSRVIRGKEGAVYQTHGAIALQTQNYPSAANTKNFPPCELQPGEIYSHDIVYRFWVRAGDPTKWKKRNEKPKIKQ